MALEHDPDSPAPLRVISQLMGDYIARLGAQWIEGEIAQLTRQGVCFLTLRDLDAKISMSVTCRRIVLDRSSIPITEGAGVVVHARPDFYPTNGTRPQRARLAGDAPASSSVVSCSPPRASSTPPAAAAAVPPPAASPDHGQGLRRRARRPRTPVRWPGGVRGRVRPHAGELLCRSGDHGPARARRRRGGRCYRDRPRGRFRRGPAAVLGRGPGARGRGCRSAGGERDRYLHVPRSTTSPTSARRRRPMPPRGSSRPSRCTPYQLRRRRRKCGRPAPAPRAASARCDPEQAGGRPPHHTPRRADGPGRPSSWGGLAGPSGTVSTSRTTPPLPRRSRHRCGRSNAATRRAAAACPSRRSPAVPGSEVALRVAHRATSESGDSWAIDVTTVPSAVCATA